MTDTEKNERYAQLLPQMRALMEGESDEVACMANFCSLLHEEMGFLWTGFYCVKGDELVLGPFQGPVACTRIKKGRGVCGTSWLKEETIVVSDVEQFPDHIACSSLSRSEMVVPVWSQQQGSVAAVLDIDSRELGTFSDVDRRWMEQMVKLLPF